MLETAVRRLVNGYRLPGRDVVVELASRLLARRQRLREGKVGAYRVHLDLGDTIQSQVYFGTYETENIALVKRILRPGDVFFDLGANIGHYSLVAAQVVGNSGEVHSFEPIPGNADILQRAIDENSIPNIVLNRAAVGARSGSLTLHIAADDLGNSGWASQVPSPRRPRQINVKMLSLDDYMLAAHLSSFRLLKIDVEGAEPEAFAGAARLLAQPDAPDILCEVNPFLLDRQGLDSRSMTACLAGYGYLLGRVGGLTPEGLDPERKIVTGVDLYCTKDSARLAELARRSRQRSEQPGR